MILCEYKIRNAYLYFYFVARRRAGRRQPHDHVREHAPAWVDTLTRQVKKNAVQKRQEKEFEAQRRICRLFGPFGQAEGRKEEGENAALSQRCLTVS